jgi:hypothetical protein
MDGRAFKRNLARLAVETNNASAGAVLDRLGRLFDEIHIDEVQDLNGYDLEVLLELLESSIDLHLVGDVRQALLLTNPEDPKNKQFKGIKVKHWFAKQEKKDLLEVSHAETTWRCNQTIADFADSIFDVAWGFHKTLSRNTTVTGHDGLFAVATEHVDAYVKEFAPFCLRHSKASAKSLDLPFTNFGQAKGMAAHRVLIAPTDGIRRFLTSNTPLEGVAACSLYVAVTRAQASVAFVVDHPGQLGIPVWTPSVNSATSCIRKG